MRVSALQDPFLAIKRVTCKTKGAGWQSRCFLFYFTFVRGFRNALP
jgi:hypothetical protein